MSILNVFLRPDKLLGVTDTLARDAATGKVSTGPKLLLIPQQNPVLAMPRSAQFFSMISGLSLQASLRISFAME